MNPLLEKYHRLVEGYHWPKSFVSWSFLACVSAVLERRCWFDAQGFGYVYPNIYVVLVGNAASRKTTVADRAVDWLAKDLGDDGPVFSANMTTPAALILALKDAENAKGHLWGHSPLFIYSSEMAVFLKDIGGGEVVDLLIDLYDTRRPGDTWMKRTVKDGKIEIMSPSLTMLACTTPTWMQQYRMSDTAGIGFTSRCLWVHEPVFVPGISKPPHIDIPLLKEIQQQFLRMSRMAGEFVFMNGAQASIDREVAAANAWGSSHPGTGIFASYMARKVANIRKVSMLFSAMRDDKRIIKGCDVDEAAALITALEPTLVSAFGFRVVYRDENLTTKFLNLIPLPGMEIPEDTIMDAIRNEGQAITDGRELDEVLRGMRRMGMVEFYRNEAGKLIYRRLK